MPVYELAPRFKVGPLEIGRRVGYLIGQAAIGTYKADFVLERHSEGCGGSFGVLVKVTGPDSVMVAEFGDHSCDGKTAIHLSRQAINQHPVVRGKLRWLPAV